MIGIEERVQDNINKYQLDRDKMFRELRVAIPGIIQSVNYEAQTVEVQCAIREKMIMNRNVGHIDIPILLDVPFFYPTGGGYMVTMPVNVGDECLVVFADMYIDAWWQSGGVQNQVERRRHDLSDGFAIIGFHSQPKRISGYSGNSVQIRTESGGNFIELQGGTVNIVADVNISGNLTVSSNATVNGSHTVEGNLSAGGINMNNHTHRGDSGGSTGGLR